MKTIIGSKRALELARKEFGERAYVLRRGKMFEVGKVLGGLGCIKTGKMWGEGRSWESAPRFATPVSASRSPTRPR